MKEKKERKGVENMSVYLGLCGHCGANKNSQNFKSRPAGRHFDVEKWLLQDDNGRKLHFFLVSHKYDRVCNGCCVKNNKLVQASQPMLRLSPVSQGPPRKRCDVFTLATPTMRKLLSRPASSERSFGPRNAIWQPSRDVCCSMAACFLQFVFLC